MEHILVTVPEIGRRPSGVAKGLDVKVAEAFRIPSYWNCFVVVLPAEIPSGFTPEDIIRLVARRKAGGFRKVATVTPTTLYADQ